MPEKKEVKEKKLELKVKVVAINDYLVKAKALFGSEKRWENAVALIYTENEVIQVLERKGEQRFVVKI